MQASSPPSTSRPRDRRLSRRNWGAHSKTLLNNISMTKIREYIPHWQLNGRESLQYRSLVVVVKMDSLNQAHSMRG
ncbi:hypothetical protein CFIMG_008515RA00001 [Ceratocystis fimbriata CBS 114723]|uniref:Uncharacterized protein n=1 Tax=Ceratocystis fimbriata CBS 114723 TaxID=1035309 RepID=A0A2C5X8V3_9PEZI|nr:hypothetical protein CFIMG_008515RA00001 [Ceratocystis fimbriata CBS 114723]